MKVKKYCIFIISMISFVFLNITEASEIETILRVAVNPNLPPYQFVEDEQIVGLHIDILDNIAQEHKLIIEYVPKENDTEALKALVNGEVDLILGVLNGNGYNNLTDNISQSSLIMVASRQNAETIKDSIYYGKYIAAFEERTFDFSFVHELRKFRYLIVSNQVEAYEKLVSKKVDAIVGVRNSILYQLEKDNIISDYTIINNFMLPIEYSIEVKNGDEDLLNKINFSLQEMRISGEYENIYNRWINEDKYIKNTALERFFKISLVLSAIIILLFLVAIRINQMLKKQVYEKTRELQEANTDLEKQIIQTRNYNELTNLIVENSPSVIIVFDRDFKITIFNKSASYLTGIKSIVIGENILSIPLIKSVIGKIIDNIFREDTIFLNEEIKIKNDNEIRNYRYSIYKLFNNEGEIRGAILSIDDITEKLKLQQKIFNEDKNLALNQMIAGIAHEIRNPFMSIKTFIELIPLKINNKNFQKQLTEIVPKEVDRVDNLIRNLIDYSKPEDNIKENIDLFEIIKSSIALIEPTLKQNKINLIIEKEGRHIVYADKDQLKQVFINILLNGYDSMIEKKRLNENAEMNMYIKLWVDKDYSVIQIKDEGIGMTEEQIERATEPFYTNKSQGTGLGLYLTKQFVEENGGTILIESSLSEFSQITLKFRRSYEK